VLFSMSPVSVCTAIGNTQRVGEFMVQLNVRGRGVGCVVHNHLQPNRMDVMVTVVGAWP